MNARNYRLSAQTSVKLLFQEKRSVSDCLITTAMSIFFYASMHVELLNATKNDI